MKPPDPSISAEMIPLAADGKSIILICQKMRITVDIDAKALRRIQQVTGQKKMSPAVSQALDAFLRQQARREFIERAISGQTDFALTNEELEAQDLYEAH